MSATNNPSEKTRMHPRNRNRERYDFRVLTDVLPELSVHIRPNKYGTDSIDFADPVAVKLLNAALLYHYYGIEYWIFPDENLCPPIPGRADYIHHMADVLAENNFGQIPKGENITCYDIGVGASCIYPIIGVVEYGWSFIGSDIDTASIASAQNIVDHNPPLLGKVALRRQKNSRDVFYGAITHQEKIDLTICNPPFHASVAEAQKGTRRKVRNLTGQKSPQPKLNFSGISKELICDGGENKFIRNMIKESRNFADNCLWFSTLVSKQSNLKGIHDALRKAKTAQARTIAMGTGNKSTRIVAWTFLSKLEQKEWRESRWMRTT